MTLICNRANAHSALTSRLLVYDFQFTGHVAGKGLTDSTVVNVGGADYLFVTGTTEKKIFAAKLRSFFDMAVVFVAVPWLLCSLLCLGIRVRCAA